MNTSSSLAVEHSTLDQEGLSTNSNSLEMDAATLDEVACPSWVTLTRNLVEGAMLGKAKGARLGGAEWGNRLDLTLGFGAGTWARGGGVTWMACEWGGVVGEDRASARDTVEACTMLSPLEEADTGNE
jgi:hypothetical protein